MNMTILLSTDFRRISWEMASFSAAKFENCCWQGGMISMIRPYINLLSQKNWFHESKIQDLLANYQICRDFGRICGKWQIFRPRNLKQLLTGWYTIRPYINLLLQKKLSPWVWTFVENGIRKGKASPENVCFLYRSKLP